MAQIDFQRVRFSVEADNRLKSLKAKTGITPNLLCRIGFCLSLEEPGLPRSDDSEPSSREINRNTLLGDYDRIFVALLCVRHPEAIDDADQLYSLFVQHLHRGVLLLANRVKDVSSLADLVPRLPRSAESPSSPA